MLQPLRPIEFEVRTPVPDAKLREHVAWAMRRGYPEVQEGLERPGVVNIVASGPSALDARLDGLTVAVNGSLKLFTDRGLAPSWWAGCDPQRSMARFLKRPPPTTIYLVASKCDRAVFRALQNRRVLLWHIDDVAGHEWAVPTATTITLTALSLLRRMGFRQFRTWGWDGCYLDGKDHAMPQKHSAENITVEVGSQTFHTTPTWAIEAQDAVFQLETADYKVDVRGPGMIGAMLRALSPHAMMS